MNLHPALQLKPSPVDFHEENHTYTLNTGVNVGKLVPGVTTITGPVGFPSEVASAWAAKECVGFLNAKIGARKSVSASVLRKWLPEAKGAYKRKSTAAADHGTEAHDCIEKYVDQVISTGFRSVHLPVSVEATEAVLAFQDWEQEHNPQWLASELVVGSLVHEFGGKLDALAVLDGKLTLVDFKTSNHISDSYYLQTAGYALALKEMGAEVEDRLILRIDKTGKGFEARKVPTPLDLDTQTFIALRQVQRWNSFVSNN
jgi:hypothetical protein